MPVENDFTWARTLAMRLRDSAGAYLSYLICSVALCSGLALACGSGASTVDFEITDPGTGEPNEDALWPMFVGDYLEGAYVVESKKNDIYRVFQVAESDVSLWRKTGNGIAFIASAQAGGSSEPLLLVPNEVRDNMTWVTSRALPGAVTVVGEAETPTGTKRIWESRVGHPGEGQVVYRFIEGYGPARGVTGGVLLENDAGEGIAMPTALVSTTKTIPRALVGLEGLSAVDIMGHEFMLMLTRRIPSANGSVIETKLSCLLGTGEMSDAAEVVDITMPATNVCPTRTARDGIGSDHEYSSPENATPFDGAVLWSPTVEFSNDTPRASGFAPHVVNGNDYRAYYRDLLSSPSYLGSQQFGGGASTFVPDLWTAQLPMNAVSLDIASTPVPARVVVEHGGYVQAGAIDGLLQQPLGRRWYVPGQRSVRTHDDGREVWVVRPDGALYDLGIEGNRMSFSLAAKLEVQAGLPITGAVRQGQNIISGVSTLDISKAQMLQQAPLPEPQAIELPESLGFVVTGTLPLLYVCPPASVSNLESLELTIDGMAPRFFFEDSERTDGCAVAIAQPTAMNAIVGATLPSAGRVTAFPSQTQAIYAFGGFKATSVRGGGFIAGSFHGTAAGSIDRPTQYASFASQTPPASYVRDVGGYGHWSAAPNNVLRLSDSDHDNWRELPFATITTQLRSVSSLGKLYVCGRDTGGIAGCLAVHIDGSFESVSEEDIAGLIAEVDDGSRCFSDSLRVWCGQPDDNSNAVLLSEAQNITDVMPFSTGFYFRKAATDPYRYFNISANAIEELTMEVTRMYRISDDALVGVSGTKIVDINGKDATEVFDAAPFSTAYGLTLNDENFIPGLGYVIVGGLPLPYEL